MSYEGHRISRQNVVSYASHLVSRQSQVATERHLVSRRAQYARQKDVCFTCRVDAIEFRDRDQCRMGAIWFLRRAQYAQRFGVVSYGRHRVSLSARYTRRKDVLCTVCRMDAIAFRDVHNTHDVRAYARHGGVTCPPVNCATCTVRSMPRRKSYKRLQRVVLTTSGFAT